MDHYVQKQNVTYIETNTKTKDVQIDEKSSETISKYTNQQRVYNHPMAKNANKDIISLLQS